MIKENVIKLKFPVNPAVSKPHCRPKGISLLFSVNIFFYDIFVLYPVQYHVNAVFYAGGSITAFALCYRNRRTIHLLYIKASGLQFMLLSVRLSY